MSRVYTNEIPKHASFSAFLSRIVRPIFDIYKAVLRIEYTQCARKTMRKDEAESKRVIKQREKMREVGLKDGAVAAAVLIGFLGDFRILGNELVNELIYVYTSLPDERLNVDKFKNGATGYRRQSRACERMLIADVAVSSRGRMTTTTTTLARCRRLPRICLTCSYSRANTTFYSRGRQ